MSKSRAGAGKGPGRPSGRGPGHRRPGGSAGGGRGYTGGTNHKSSFATVPQVRAAIAVFLVFPAVVLVSLAGYFLHGYGVI